MEGRNMNKNQPAKKVSYKKTFKNYNRLRDFIRNVFLYGCRNRKDYLELNIKKAVLMMTLSVFYLIAWELNS